MGNTKQVREMLKEHGVSEEEYAEIVKNSGMSKEDYDGLALEYNAPKGIMWKEMVKVYEERYPLIKIEGLIRRMEKRWEDGEFEDIQALKREFEEGIKDSKIFRNDGDTEDEKSKSSKTKTKSKGKGGRPKGKSLKTIQRHNWVRDKYYFLKDKRSGSTYEEFADLIYSELREKTPHYFDKSYKKSTILKVLKNKLWAEE